MSQKNGWWCQHSKILEIENQKYGEIAIIGHGRIEVMTKGHFFAEKQSKN